MEGLSFRGLVFLEGLHRKTTSLYGDILVPDLPQFDVLRYAGAETLWKRIVQYGRHVYTLTENIPEVEAVLDLRLYKGYLHTTAVLRRLVAENIQVTRMPLTREVPGTPDELLYMIAEIVNPVGMPGRFLSIPVALKLGGRRYYAPLSDAWLAVSKNMDRIIGVRRLDGIGYKWVIVETEIDFEKYIPRVLKSSKLFETAMMNLIANMDEE